MASKYKLNLTDEHIKELMEDPEMDGITLEATTDEGSKVMITLTKSNMMPSDEMPSDEMSSDEMSSEEEGELGNVAPEEQAALDAAMTQENVGFTNESTIKTFNNFLKTL
jgi:hypothetical protein